jgi:iron-sulfur cluster insertion protein
MLQFTDNAKLKIIDILNEHNALGTRLRIAIVGGGCAGLNYQFLLDEDYSEDDFMIDTGGVKAVVDCTSAQYLEGATVDYVEELWESKFVVDNPNAQTSCGCGSSFLPRID